MSISGRSWWFCFDLTENFLNRQNSVQCAEIINLTLATPLAGALSSIPESNDPLSGILLKVTFDEVVVGVESGHRSTWISCVRLGAVLRFGLLLLSLRWKKLPPLALWDLWVAGVRKDLWKIDEERGCNTLRMNTGCLRSIMSTQCGNHKDFSETQILRKNGDFQHWKQRTSQKLISRKIWVAEKFSNF